MNYTSNIDNNSQSVFSVSRHVTYDKTQELIELLFREKSQTCYIVSKDDDKTSPQVLSLEARKFLENSGFTIIPVRKTHLVGVKNICGINICIDKIGGEFSGQLSIRIQGTDDSDLDSKTRTIKNFIKEQCNVEPDVNTFARDGMC